MSLDVMLTVTEPTEVFQWNITHNLGKMASEAGIYEALWRPEEINVTTAEQLVPLLTAGLETLLGNPDHFHKFNPENGWGTYEELVTAVEKYLEACIENPDAEVRACR